MIKAKPLWPVIGLAMVLAIANCSRSNSNASGTSDKATPAVLETTARQDQYAQQTQKQNKNISQAASNAKIDSITISPLNPTSDTTISVTVETTPAELQDMDIQYIFWVNATISQKGSENTFSLADFKKNDFFFIDAVLLKDDREVYRKRSSMVKILNRSPEIKSIDLPVIKGPGTYNIKINAIDADSDPLNYSLAGDPLPTGLTIDSTGLAKISLMDQSPENIVFLVIVKDNEDGEVKQEVKISFTKNIIRNNLNPEEKK